MFSIICPCYNSSKYIKSTLDCILKQKNDGFNYELICIDDGSTDNTIEILKSYENQYLKHNINYIIIEQENYGPGSARNSGIKEASQEYIAFIDSDDTWHENKLSYVYDIIKKNKGDYNLYIHDEYYSRINKNKKLIRHDIISYDNIPNSLYRKNSLSTSAVIMETKLVKSSKGFDEKLMSSQDWDFWLRLAPQLKIKHINKVLGVYNENINSITSRFYVTRMLDQLKIAYRFKDYVSNYIFIYKVTKIIFSKQWFYGLRNIIFNKKGHNY